MSRQDRKTPEWILRIMDNKTKELNQGEYRCSYCGEIMSCGDYNCPNCGRGLLYNTPHSIPQDGQTGGDRCHSIEPISTQHNEPQSHREDS